MATSVRAPESILVVEDSPDFQLLVNASLCSHYSVTIAATLAEARELIREKRFQLLILDGALPDGDGFDFCAELRKKDVTRLLPVIFLTGRAELEDKLKGFSLGADDYIVKPFDALELRARVEAKLARERAKSVSFDEVFVKGDLHLHIPTQRAFLAAKNGAPEELGLTPIEFKILYHLARNDGQVCSREQLLERVWGKATHVFDRATDKHVSSLRQKLGAEARSIETVARVGYRFLSSPNSSQ